MVYVTRSKVKNCGVGWCRLHYGRWKAGPHIRCERVIPKPGHLEGAVWTVQHLDGRREAYMRLYTNHCWSGPLPLPEEPTRPFVGAVNRARRFVNKAVAAR